MRIQETQKILKEAKVMQHDVSSPMKRSSLLRRMMRNPHIRGLAKQVAMRVAMGIATGVLAAAVRGVRKKQEKKNHPLRHLKLAKIFG